jgi:FtsH-binding integral membrane protein
MRPASSTVQPDAVPPDGTRGARFRSARVPFWVGLALDACCVIVFVVIGLASHHHRESLSGLAAVAWPFLAGLAVGLLVTRAWRQPAAIVPAGLGAWLGAVAVGMLLRVAAGQGTAPAFIGVALAFLGLFLLGWRAAAGLAQGLRTTS